MKLLTSSTGQYTCSANLNLYDDSHCKDLATQAASGRYLKLVSSENINNAMQVCLCEDDYLAWLPSEQLIYLQPANQVYQPVIFNRTEIVQRIPEIIAFTKAAMKIPNCYLWGGTVAPNYDCSGLMQAAFTALGVWLPRDSYQQADFTETIDLAEIMMGDLIFFAKNKRVNHVALYLGDGEYIHSSGKDMGRNGIGIDRILEVNNTVSQGYYELFYKVGRVMSSYQPS